MRRQRSNILRQSLAREAARLMYEEGVKQYLDAKYIAAKRLLGRGGDKKMRYHPKDLPSNGEIQTAMRTLIQFTEGELSQQRLFAMRVIALEIMKELVDFKPRLIGSVSTGHVHYGSDIDLHVFTDNIEEIEFYLNKLGWIFKTKQVTIRVGGKYKEYTHIYSERIFMIELSVYSNEESRIRQRSSTDGKPIIRLKVKALEKLLAKEHSKEWINYLKTGEIIGIEQFQNLG
jgi:hypothetical protein